MKVELTDIIQVTTAKNQSKLVSIGDILKLIPMPKKTTQKKTTPPVKNKAK